VKPLRAQQTGSDPNLILKLPIGRQSLAVQKSTCVKAALDFTFSAKAAEMSSKASVFDIAKIV
jgi:hypothetical protein